jgi:hypothetical protein
LCTYRCTPMRCRNQGILTPRSNSISMIGVFVTAHTASIFELFPVWPVIVSRPSPQSDRFL